MKSEKEKSIDLFDILGDKEDNITNVLKFLFENLTDFRSNLSNLIFGNISDSDEIKFETRRSYTSCTGKNIPDIILYNKNHFAIIEVKLFADEGSSQTIRYYNAIPEIKNKLNIESQESLCYYLTIYGTEAECKQFKSLSWLKDIKRCLESCQVKPDLANSKSLMIYLLQKQLKERIDSIKGDNISKFSNWIESVKSIKWCREANFVNAVKLLDMFTHENEFDDAWCGWDSVNHAYVYSAQLRPSNQWLGKKIDLNSTEIPNGSFADYYDFHIEMKYLEQEQNNDMTMKHMLEIRLDYHLNPYLSKKEIENISNEDMKNFIKKCNLKRVEIAKKAYEKLPKHLNEYRNGRLSNDFLFILKRNFDIKQDDRIIDVWERTKYFIEECIDLIQCALDEINNQEL
jgi:hypothetical protein